MSKDAIHRTCKNGDLDRVKELVASGVRVIDKDKKGCTPLYYSVYHNHIDVVKYLLEAGADPNLVCYDKYKRLPLTVASETGHLEAVVCLLDNSARVNLGDKDNNTPLHFAALIGHAEIVEILISRGADLNKANNCGETPLHSASDWGIYNTATVLLQHGADPAAYDNSGQTPLHAAASSGSKNVVQLFLQHQVQIVKDEDGKTPLDAAHSRMQEPQIIKTKTLKVDFENIISMLENYIIEQKSQSNKNKREEMKTQKPKPEIGTKEKVGDKTQTPNSGIDVKEKMEPETKKSDSKNDTKMKVDDKSKKSESKIESNKYAAGSRDLKNEIEKEKTESCIIDQDIAENVLAANARMKEQEREVKKMFEGTEADEYLKDIYKKISNIGKEITKPEKKITHNLLSDNHLLKLANNMDGVWKMVGGFLGVQRSDIKELAEEHKTEPKYAAWCMLITWRDTSEGSVKDRIQVLKGALLDVDREDIADML